MRNRNVRDWVHAKERAAGLLTTSLIAFLLASGAAHCTQLTCPSPPAACTLPGEALSIVFTNQTNMSWTAPTNTGSPPPLLYDTHRVTRPNAYSSGYSSNCVEISGTDQATIDTSTPVVGQVYYYTVEAKTLCGLGSMGTGTGGLVRTAVTCGGGNSGFEAPNGASLPPEGRSIARLPTGKNAGSVYPHSGEYFLEQTDLRIPGRGMDLVWRRKYRSREGRLTTLGYNWDFSYNISIAISGDNPADRWVYDGSSRRDTYTPTTPSCWTAAGMFNDLCLQGDGTYTLTFPDMTVWTLAALNGLPQAGKITSIRDRNLNQLTFAYNGFGGLATITDTLGRLTTVSYTGGFISAVTDFAGRQVQYAYYSGPPGGSSGDLRTVRTPVVTGTPNGNDFPAGKTTTYTYSTGLVPDSLNHNLLTIKDPLNQVFVTNVYASTSDSQDSNFDRIERQILPSGSVFYVYALESPTAANGFAVVRTLLHDRVGNVREAYFNSLSQLVQLNELTGRVPNLSLPVNDSFNRPVGKLRTEDPDVFQTRIDYNADSLKTQAVAPNGSSMQFVYEINLNPAAPRRSQGNLREIHRLAGPLGGDQTEIVQRFEYAAGLGGCCGDNFATRVIDGRGNETLHTYNGFGNRTHTQHRIPTIVEEFEYNGFGQLTAHVFPLNGVGGTRRRDTYAYYGGGPQKGYLFQRTMDALGRALTTTFEYNSVGSITRMIDPLAHDTLYSVNALSQVVRETTPEVATGSGIRYYRDYFYDGNDQLVRIDVANIDDAGVQDPANPIFTTTYARNAVNDVTSRSQEVEPSRNVVTEYGYDGNQNLTLVRLGEATNGNQPTNVMQKAFDERDLIYRDIECSVPSQVTTQYNYDCTKGLLVLQEGLEAPTPRVTNFTSDGYGRRMTATDPLGNMSLYHYDANSNLASHRAEGELIDVGGGAGNVRLYEETHTLDPMDRETREDVAFFDTTTQAAIGDGFKTTRLEYNDLGKITRILDDNNQDERIAYDSTHQEATFTDSVGNTISYVYDGNLNVTTRTETELVSGGPSQVFTVGYTYDNLDRVTTVADTQTNTIEYRYDSRDNTTQFIDGVRPNNPTDPGNVTRYSYDGMNRPIQMIQQLTYDGTGTGYPYGMITNTRVWDDSSRLKDECDGNNHCTHYDYDCSGRKLQATFADRTTESYSYDPFDNVVLMIDANGNSVSSTYDLLDGPTSLTFVPGAGVSSQTTFEGYQYDGLSRVVSAQDNDASVTRRYDSLGDVTSETVNGRTTSSTFDAEGNLLGLTYPGGRVITTTYDSLNRKTSISDSGGSIATYTYAGAGRVKDRTYGNGTRTTYSYDGILSVPNDPNDFGFKQVSRITHELVAGGSAFDDHTFGWDRMGNKTRKEDLLVQTLYGVPKFWNFYYDSVYRLHQSRVTDWGGFTMRFTDYTIDAAGNRQYVSGTDGGSYYRDPSMPEPADDQMNQYTDTAFDVRSYDADGNLHQLNDYAAGDERDFIYDAKDQLVEVDDPITGVIIQYAYDPFGRRLQKTVDSGGPIQTTRYLYNEYQEIEEQNGVGATQATYVFGNGADEVLTMKRGGLNYYYHADDLGNITTLTDGAGSVVESYDYDDFGKPLSTSSVGNPIMFGGRPYDAEVGLSYFRTRYLDPRAGRFINRDTIGLWGDEANSGNPYTYAGNNPWSRTDPTGEYVQPTFENCSGGQAVRAENSLEEAQYLARRSYYQLSFLPAQFHACDQDYLVAFGIWNRSRFERVRGNFSSILHGIGQKSYNFKCEPDTSYCQSDDCLACVDNNWDPSQKDIHLCPAFFDCTHGLVDAYFGRYDSLLYQGGILLHEMSHIMAGTEDLLKTHDMFSLAGYAKRDPGGAVRNSYSHEFYSELPKAGFCNPILSNFVVNFARENVERAAHAVERSAKGVGKFAKRAADKVKKHLPGHHHHRHH